MSENVPPQRREVVAVALWKDEISDEKQKEIPRPSDNLTRKIKRFLSYHLFSRTPRGILSGKARLRELRQKYGRIYIFS